MNSVIFSHQADVETQQLGALQMQVFGHSAHMTVLHWILPDGSVFPEHQHPQEQLAYVIRGCLHMTVSGQSAVLKAGDAVIVPSNTPHSVTVEGETETIDVFSPIRTELPGFLKPGAGNR
jgi:quercetin dioxygenase-like cupin family protein